MKIKGIVFDKDGTLLDYDKCWRPVTLATVEYVASMYPGADACREGVRNRLGVLPDGTMDIDGPHCRGFHDKIAGAFIDEYELFGIEFDREKLAREVGEGFKIFLPVRFCRMFGCCRPNHVFKCDFFGRIVPAALLNLDVPTVPVKRGQYF